MTNPGENTHNSSAEDINAQIDATPNATGQPASPISVEQGPIPVPPNAQSGQEETTEVPSTQSDEAQANQDQGVEAQANKEQDDLDCPISEDTKTCPEPHWIELELRDEENKPVSGVYAVYIDSAGKEHNMSFSGQAILRKNVAKGKGRLILRRSILYNKALTLPQRPEAGGSLVEPKVPEKKGYKETERTYVLASWHEGLTNDSKPAAKTQGEIEKQLETLKSYVIEIEGIKPELVLVAGTQYDSAKANKLSFPGHAVRFLHESSMRPATILIFTQSYTAGQLDAVEESAKSANASLKILSSFQNFVDYINTRGNASNGRLRNPIGELRIYSHGVINNIAFGYQVDERLNLTSSNYQQLKRNAFEPTAQLFSFACRTGMGPDQLTTRVVDSFPTDDRKNSLAQKLADHLNITVHAYIRRSDYRDTWNTEKERLSYYTCPHVDTTTKQKFKLNWENTPQASEEYCLNYQDQEQLWQEQERTIDAMWLQKGARHPVKVSDGWEFSRFSGKLEPFYPRANR